jgi:hypothetical protein
MRFNLFVDDSNDSVPLDPERPETWNSLHNAWSLFNFSRTHHRDQVGADFNDWS